MTELKIDAEQTPNGFLVRLDGDADGQQVDELDRQLLVHSNVKPKLLVLDLSRLNFISSADGGCCVHPPDTQSLMYSETGAGTRHGRR